MNYAIVLSGGTGTRTGLHVPKQYYKVNGKPIVSYVIDTLEKSDSIDGIVIVAASEWQNIIQKSTVGNKKIIGFCEPGENRQLSIYHGLLKLKSIAKEDDIVLIQDAARPNTTAELIEKCIQSAERADGAMPTLKMKDTIYLSGNGTRVDSLLNRNQLFAGQAPEAFSYGKYLKANEKLLPEKILQINGSTEPAILSGMHIAIIDGEEKNYKITTAADLEHFCAQMKEGEGK